MTWKIEERPQALPLRMGPGQVIRTTLDEEDVVIVGANNRAPVIMTSVQWEMLQQYKLTRLTFSGTVRGGDGHGYHVPLARLFAGIQYDANRTVYYRNGNALDLRPSNLHVLHRCHLNKKRPNRPQQGQAKNDN